MDPGKSGTARQKEDGGGERGGDQRGIADGRYDVGPLYRYVSVSYQ